MPRLWHGPVTRREFAEWSMAYRPLLTTDAAIEAILDGLRWLDLDWDGEEVYQFSRAARHADVAGSVTVREAIPALAELAGQIGDPAVRHRGTIGGSLANNDPTADYPAAVMALDATIVTNKRSIKSTILAEDGQVVVLGGGEVGGGQRRLREQVVEAGREGQRGGLLGEQAGVEGGRAGEIGRAHV